MVRLDLARRIRPFTRCLRCNGLLHEIDAAAIESRIPERSRQYYSRFLECGTCRNVYWEGSHLARMRKHVEQIIATVENAFAK